MLKILLARLAQGHRTARFPDIEPQLPERFRGRPVLDPAKCADGCSACIAACPTGALAADAGLSVDLGRCLFCSDCVAACPEGAIFHSDDYRLAARGRDELIVRTPGTLDRRALVLGDELRRLFGRSLKLRQVSAGGCNGCESDVNVLGTVVFDLGRFLSLAYIKQQQAALAQAYAERPAVFIACAVPEIWNAYWGISQ